MPTPLTFKGDKKSKKRKRHAHDDRDTSQHGADDQPSKAVATVSKDETVDDEDSWVTAESVTDITGPIILVLPTAKPTCLACDMHGEINASNLENIVEGNPSSAEPHDVRQVWVATRVAGTETFTLKGHHGRYLGCDRFGIISAKKEAISMEESWLCVPVSESAATFALKTQRDKYLSVKEKEEGEEVEIRGDGEDVDEHSTVRIRMQARFKPKLKAVKEEKVREKISRKELEEAVGRRLEDHEVKTLKRARKDGSYYEALLDVKVKGKHDKFA